MLELIASNIMRTTLDVDGTVLNQLRARAAKEGKSMGQVASEMLAPALAESERVREGQPLRWASKKMGTPKIDLEDKESLWLSLDREHREKQRT
jgi:plasmid stability protein